LNISLVHANNDGMTERGVLAIVVACGLFGCAHWSSSPTPSGVAVSLAENGHPASDGIIGIYNVCIDASGTAQSVRVVQAMPGGQPGYEDSLRRSKYDPRQTRPCFDIHRYCDDCNANAAAAASSPANGTSSANTDADAPPPAVTGFKNIPPMSFDDQRVVSPVPLLPGDFKIRHVGERLIFVAKICAASDGRIAQVSILQGIPGADDAIVGTI
jgi:hypothetical protein